MRALQPLVHCITATVSMNIVANGLLAAGARPMMTETASDAPAMDSAASALLINLGTLSTDGTAGIPPTVAAARGRGIPWVLDPAAIGLGPTRTALAKRLVTLAPAVVRANASEILSLGGLARGGRGADSLARPEEAGEEASHLARLSGTVVACSGPRDLITDGRHTAAVAGGTPLLTRVTGTGCLLGALTAACVSVAPAFDAAVAASMWLKRAGELAAARTGRPGSFGVALYDALDEVGENPARFPAPEQEES
ncbi:hydroxyethylthiazole kinase [Neoactinobaculum massilliense]|uniref:hydroxyethylthiazole kinase n=1 Tax=Neoactinobaculum massilliense TaxID=2364794 RepID=UPI000F530ED6|nr:hydroxyethylthiazole kinase [Neoactinobaculum massilliense]